jgi:hypothetical protein
MPAVADIMRQHGYSAQFQPVVSEGKVGRIAASKNGVNFFVNFLGNSEKYASVGFFTVTENSDNRSLLEVNSFNAQMRAAKIVMEGDNLCLTHDFVVNSSGMAEDTFLANLSFWEFAMGQFGQWYLSKEER